MAHNCKIFVAVFTISWALEFVYIHMLVQFQGICINQEKEICLPNKEYVSDHK